MPFRSKYAEPPTSVYPYQAAETPISFLRASVFARSGQNGYRFDHPQPRPPVYDATAATKGESSRSVWWNPISWTRRTRVIIGIIVFIVLLAGIIGAAVARVENNPSAYPDYSAFSYSIADTYQGSNFFSNWDYWDAPDPDGGFVHYDNAADAANRNLTGYDAASKTVYLKVDNSEIHAVIGPHSARISTRTTYDSGLFIFDIAHAPYGCTIWPSIKLVNQHSRSQASRLDVFESFNEAANGTQMALRTTEGCTMSDTKRSMTGQALQGKCKSGCSVQGPPSSSGKAFNDRGGGVYALELRKAGIRIWLFYRDEISADITNGTAPDLSTWGEPLADFPCANCDIGSHFGNLSIVADIAVCGKYMGSAARDACPSDCQVYATSHPRAFDEAYWNWNYFKVYKAV